MDREFNWQRVSGVFAFCSLKTLLITTDEEIYGKMKRVALVHLLSFPHLNTPLPLLGGVTGLAY